MLGAACDSLEFDLEQLTGVVKYIPSPVMIDFDEQQMKIIKKAIPNKKCNFAILDGSELCNALRYMPPPGGVVKYMPPPNGVLKYMPPPVVVRYMPPPIKKK
jgi:hypothetical protein